MKTSKLLTTLALGMLLISFTSCNKINKSVIIIKDCTGDYLKWNNNDYKICNPDIISSFSNGGKVEATFRTVKKCNNDEENNKPVCEMYHHYKSYIEVTKVK